MPDTRVRRAHRRSRRRSRAVCSSHVPRAPASSTRRATTRWPQGRAALLPAPRCTPRQLPSRILRAVAAPHVACLTLTSESPRIAPPPPLSHRRHHSAAASAYPLACHTAVARLGSCRLCSTAPRSRQADRYVRPQPGRVWPSRHRRVSRRSPPLRSQVRYALRAADLPEKLCCCSGHQWVISVG